MNLQFFMVAVALCLLALAFLLYPLLRDRSGIKSLRSRREMNIDVYRDRVRELELDLAAGTLSREQYDVAITDLDRDMVESGVIEPDSDTVDGRPGDSRNTIIATSVAGVVAVPLMAFMFYGMYGDERAFQPTEQAPVSGQRGDMESPDAEQFRQLVEQLRQRMEQNPDDAQGWVMLGRTLSLLEEYREASAAYARAVELGRGNDPDVLTQYADTLAHAEGSLTGRPSELADRALALDPEHGFALWLSGRAAFEQGRHEEAREHWLRLQGILPEDSNESAVVRRSLEEVERLLGE